MKTKTKQERINYIFENLSRLPFFAPKKVTDCIYLNIMNYPEHSELEYKINDEVFEHLASVHDQIFDNIAKSANAMDIVVITPI